MTNKEINIAIAEACGWKVSSFGWWINPDDTNGGDPGPPDYCNDLNAMREAAIALRVTDRMQYALYHKQLERVVAIGNSTDEAHSWMVADATAKQRAESFLRVKGLWNKPRI